MLWFGLADAILTSNLDSEFTQKRRKSISIKTVKSTKEHGKKRGKKIYAVYKKLSLNLNFHQRVKVKMKKGIS